MNSICRAWDRWVHGLRFDLVVSPGINRLDAETVLKSEDKAEIEAKGQALAQAAQKLGEKVYAEQQAKAGAQGAQSGAQPEAEAGKKDDSNVVDAEFTEVKDKKAG